MQYKTEQTNLIIIYSAGTNKKRTTVSENSNLRLNAWMTQLQRIVRVQTHQSNVHPNMGNLMSPRNRLRSGNNDEQQFITLTRSVTITQPHNL